MAHGRKRSCLGGMLFGFLLVVPILVGGWYVLKSYGVTFIEADRPLFLSSARQAVAEWGRLPPYPEGVKSFTITTSGNVFTRAFRVSFFGEPAAITEWIKTCPGVNDPQGTKEDVPGGGTRYTYPAAGGAAHAEILHFPERGTVEIYTYWS